MGLMNFSVSVRRMLIFLLTLVLLGTIFIVFYSPPPFIIFYKNKLRNGLGSISGKCAKRTKIVFLKTHKVTKVYLSIYDLI